MSPLTWILIAIITVLLGTNAYLYLSKGHVVPTTLPSQPSKVIFGLKYQAQNQTTGSILSRLQLLADALQIQGCLETKKTWAALRAALPLAASADISCTTLKTQLQEQLQTLYSQTTTPIDDNVRQLLSGLVDMVLTETCVGDKFDPQKAIALMDDVISSFCR